MNAKGYAILIGVGALAAVGLYFFARRQVAGLVSGNNAITNSQTNFAGDRVDAYQGRGIAGTLGAATNSASGGALASIGQWLSGYFDPNAGYDPNADSPIGPVILQSRKQAIGDNYYDQGVLQ